MNTLYILLVITLTNGNYEVTPKTNFIHTSKESCTQEHIQAIDNDLKHNKQLGMYECLPYYPEE